MPITQEERLAVDAVLAAAEARLLAGAERSPLSGISLEGAALIAQVGKFVERLLDNDPVAFVEYTQKLEGIWARYVRATSVYGPPGSWGYEALGSTAGL